MEYTNTYESPVLVDYGRLMELTEAIIIGGSEDGASKDIDQHHSFPIPN